MWLSVMGNVKIVIFVLTVVLLIKYASIAFRGVLNKGTAERFYFLGRCLVEFSEFCFFTMLFLGVNYSDQVDPDPISKCLSHKVVLQSEKFKLSQACNEKV